MERFFLNLKIERVWQRQYANHQEAIRDITDYMVGFYNSQRLHSILMLSAAQCLWANNGSKTTVLLSKKTWSLQG